MAEMKIVGTLKTYSKTKHFFTKEKMWRSRCLSEINGINVANSIGILTPEITDYRLNGNECSVSMKRIYSLRLDEFMRNNRKPEILEIAGAILASLHKLTESDKANSSNLPERRYLDLKRDIFKESVISEYVIKISDNVFQRALKADSDKLCFVHGDYTIQNIFYGKKLVIFDWEHSSFGCASYDIGGSLSFLTTLVLSGHWSFHDYFVGVKYFIKGYDKIKRIDSSKMWAINTFRFLGHREKSQYYLFVIEYFARVMKNKACYYFLNGKDNKKDVILFLSQFGISFNKNLFLRISRCLAKGGYKISYEFWKKYEEDTK